MSDEASEASRVERTQQLVSDEASEASRVERTTQLVNDRVEGTSQPLDNPEPRDQDAAELVEWRVAPEELAGALEAILLVSDVPQPTMQLAQVLGHPVTHVETVLQALADGYAEQGRGFELRVVSGGWRYSTRALHARAVEAFVLEGQHARLTQAALETLAVVAYRQPVSRGRIAAVRGVNVDGVMRTLLTRGLVEQAGTDPESTALLYRTTSYFLERLGLASLDELPALPPLLPDLSDLEDLTDAQR